MQITFAQIRPLFNGQSLYVTGNCNELGHWNPDKAIKLNYQEHHLWICQIDMNIENVIEYKYFVGQTNNPKEGIKWDEGNNRVLDRMMNTEQLKIMTFNIRYDCKEDGKNDWSHRKQVVQKLIQKVNPEIFGLQEVLAHQQADILANFQVNYNSIGRGRYNKLMFYNYKIIFGMMKDVLFIMIQQIQFQKTEKFSSLQIYINCIYNQKNSQFDCMIKYNLIQAEVFWFSDTPYIAGSKSYGNGFPRICTHVKLLHKLSQKVFHVYNAHFDHEHQISQIRSAEQIIKHIQQFCSPDDKIIVMGDLNSLPLSKPVKILTSSIWHEFKLENTMGVADIPIATYHAWYGLKLGIHIDYIFLGNLKTKSMIIINDQIDGQYASDHFPKVVVCE